MTTGLLAEVLDTIRDFGVPLTVNRATGETVERGWSTPGRTAVLSVEGHMQPLSDREMRFVPEGMNTLEWHNIWSLQELVEDDLVDDGSAPVVKVVKFKYWKEGPFWHAQGVTVDEQLVRVQNYEASAAASIVPTASATATFTP